MVLGTKVAFFSFINVGVVFTACVVFPSYTFLNPSQACQRHK